MRCINKMKYVKTFCGILLSGILISGCSSGSVDMAATYESENYNKSLYTGTLFAADLCVAKEDLNTVNLSTDPTLHAAGLFDLTNKNVLYSYQIHDKIYPASTTKVLTALVALKYGTLSDVVTVSARATTELDKASSVAGLKEGDRLTMEELLYGLMLPSGNDSAVAIAEHISGSTEAFVELMNQEAQALGATNSHFTNPHGLQSEDHFTTAYDLYLFFDKAMEDERFIHIIESTSYTPSITQADGTLRTGITWTPSNYYAAGKADFPENAVLIGGKTGTTDEAGSCLILMVEDNEQNPYISIVMGASAKSVLYTDMSALISSIEASDKNK